MAHTTFSKRDMEEFLKNVSSFNKKGEVHPRVILDYKGNPIPLEQYMNIIGARKLRPTFDFSKSLGEKKKVEKAKAEYKAAMRRTYGPDWKRVSKKLGYRNPMVTKEDRELIKKQMSLLNDKVL